MQCATILQAQGSAQAVSFSQVDGEAVGGQSYFEVMATLQASPSLPTSSGSALRLHGVLPCASLVTEAHNCKRV